MKRISEHEWAMKQAYINRERSTCLSRQVGAIIVKDGRAIAGGYNGAVRGAKHCDEIGGCYRKQLGCKSGEGLEYCRAAHAEANAISQCAKYGISCDGATIYVTDQPCAFCMTSIVQSGIKTVIYDGDYPHPIAMNIAKEGNLNIMRYSDLKDNI